MSLRFLLASLKQKPKQAGETKRRPVTKPEAAVHKGAGFQTTARDIRLAAERAG